jgi:hypothetical protein
MLWARWMRVNLAFSRKKNMCAAAEMAGIQDAEERRERSALKPVAV